MNHNISLAISLYFFTFYIPILNYTETQVSEEDLNLIKNEKKVLNDVEIFSVVEFLNINGRIQRRSSSKVVDDLVVEQLIYNTPEVFDLNNIDRNKNPVFIKKKMLNSGEYLDLQSNSNHRQNKLKCHTQKGIKISKITIDPVFYYFFKILTLFANKYELLFDFSEFDYIPVFIQVFLHLPMLMAIVIIISIILTYEPQITKEMILYEIASLPVGTYSKLKYSEQESCAVCLDYFNENEDVKLLKCEHIFHKECLDSWLENSLYCPLCRKSCSSLTETRNYERIRDSLFI